MSAQYRPYRDEDTSDGLDTDRLNWSDNDGIGSIQIYEKTTEDLPFHASRRTAAIGIIGVALLCVLLGFLIGYMGHQKHADCAPTMSVTLNSIREADPTIRGKIISKISADGIRAIVKEFSRQPRIPGSSLDYQLAQEVADFFRAHHFDKVEIKNYTVLLSLPDEKQPNVVKILNKDLDYATVYSTASTPTNDRSSNKIQRPVDLPFSAYSPQGDALGDVVYVNYGQPSDLLELQKLNISLTGKILIAKQLLSHADEQVSYCQDTGAAGLLLFPDLSHQDWLNEESSANIPNDAVRRDSLLWNLMGDPTTPHYPSTHYAYRVPLREIKTLPKIPVQPISSSAAYEILSQLGGRRAPDLWSDGFNFTCHLGGFQNRSLKLHLKINNQLVNRTIYNVIGTIRGAIEPDRYVIIGNHRDSWVPGAVDAAGGSGALLELSKTFGELINEGWRPRRTIMFASWGAEEHNLIGSTEWLEETLKIVQARAVAYVNADILAVGNASVSVAASPLLYQAIFNATKQVQHPDGGPQSVYDRWHETFPTRRNYSDMLFSSNNPLNADHKSILDSEDHPSGPHLEDNPTIDYAEPAPGSLLSTYINAAMVQFRPQVRALDMRSAAAPFFVFAGVPALEVTYVPKPTDVNQVSSTYSLIHTQYDTAELIDAFDKEYEFHKAAATVVAEVVRNLADSLFLPFNLLDYASALRDMFKALYYQSGAIFSQNGVSLEWLDSAIQNFTKAALNFHLIQDQLDLRDPMAIRRVNDQLLLLERAFLDTNGLPRNPMKRHLIMSPSETDSPYYEQFFPGLMDEFILLVHGNYTESGVSHWELINAHLSILVYTIQTAADVIGDSL